ncbi:MAG: hypothetical protein R2797_07300 [Gelidibacter sp.]
MRQLKLIWDFRGPKAHKIAEHHEIHLKEYIALKAFVVHKTGVETIHEFHSIAFMVVNEADMKPIRDSLKPHRGQVYSE